MENNKLSRRKFMQLGLTAVGGAAAMPVIDILDPINPLGRTQQIGLMLPQGRQFPLAGANLLDGLKLAFNETDSRVSFLSESIGVTQDSTLQAAKSLLESGIKVVVGMVSALHVDKLQSLFEAYDATLIVATAGENSIDKRHSHIFYNSLGYWQSAYAAGQWATRNFGARGMLVTSFYESGFDATYAFEKGAVEANGQIAGSKVTHISPTRSEVAMAISAIRETQPDYVYAAYRGAQAAEFLGAYEAANLGDIPLILSAFTDAHTLSSATISTWSQAANTPENTAFMRSFRQATGRTADAFAALGYDTAQWINNAKLASGSFGAFRNALAAANITGPRGAMMFDAQTNTLNSDFYLVRGGQSATGIDVVQNTAVSLELAMKTGWTFAYTAL